MKAIVERIKYNNAFLLLTLFFVLHICFYASIKELYAFRKAEISADFYYSFNVFKFFTGLLFTILFILMVTAAKIKDFLYIILVLILIFFVFPSAILFANVKGIDYRIFMAHGIFFLLVLVIGKIKIRIPSSTFNISLSQKILFYTILIGIIPFVILYSPYINYNNLFLKEIYETRALMNSRINNVYTSYTYSWFNKILIPSLVVFGLYFKNKLIVVSSVLILVFLYLCGAHKAVFIGLLMILILYKYDYKKKANYFIKFILGISIISLLVSVVFGNDFLMIMSIRRTIFLPALLDVLYFDFFDKNHLLWSETFNGLIINYPYEYSHSYVIGERYFGSKEWGANNGIISDGFMNYGMIGVLINGFIVALYFSLLNQLKINSKFFGVFFLLFFVMISSSLTTVLLTHGGFLLLLMSFLVLKNTKEKMR